MRIAQAQTRQGQRGFSLMEVLVTTVIFSIGVLGVTGLSSVSKRTAQDTVQRATASELAYALLEDMRANRDALAFYTGLADLGGGSRGAAPAACDDPANPCTAGQLADRAVWEWEQALDGALETLDGGAAGGLVSPTVCIEGPADGSAGMYTVTVVWRGGTELSATANACGAGSGLYGAADEYRRVVVLESYIDPEV